MVFFTSQDWIEILRLRRAQVDFALESAHAVAEAIRRAPRCHGETHIVNLSGRGDKDVAQMMDVLGK